MIRTLLCAVAILAAPSPASAAMLRTEPIDLAGLRGFQHADPGAFLAGVLLSVDAGLERQGAGENGLSALVAESILHSRVPGAAPPRSATISDAVEARGASLSYVVSPREVRFYLEGTPDGLAAAAPLVAAVLKTPSFDAPTLTAARAALAERMKDDDTDPRRVGRAMLRGSYYRGNAGQPPLGSPAGLAALTPDDARAFFTRWYRRGNAVVAAVGRTGPQTIAASRALSDALAPGEVVRAAPIAAKSYTAQPKRIVTQRDVGAPYVAVGFAAPAMGERDFAATLVMRALLGSIFDRVTSTTPSQIFRSIGVLYDYDVAPAQLVLWINGGQVEPQTGLAALDAVVKGMASKRLGAPVLARYKETARGEWILETLALDRRAAAIDSAVSRGLNPDTPDAVTTAIERVTAADVQRVAKKYFQRFEIALVLPRSSGS